MKTLSRCLAYVTAITLVWSACLVLSSHAAVLTLPCNVSSTTPLSSGAVYAADCRGEVSLAAIPVLATLTCPTTLADVNITVSGLAVVFDLGTCRSCTLGASSVSLRDMHIVATAALSESAVVYFSSVASVNISLVNVSVAQSTSGGRTNSFSSLLHIDEQVESSVITVAGSRVAVSDNVIRFAAAFSVYQDFSLVVVNSTFTTSGAEAASAVRMAFTRAATNVNVTLVNLSCTGYTVFILAPFSALTAGSSFVFTNVSIIISNLTTSTTDCPFSFSGGHLLTSRIVISDVAATRTNVASSNVLFFNFNGAPRYIFQSSSVLISRVALRVVLTSSNALNAIMQQTFIMSVGSRVHIDTFNLTFAAALASVADPATFYGFLLQPIVNSTYALRGVSITSSAAPRLVSQTLHLVSLQPGNVYLQDSVIEIVDTQIRLSGIPNQVAFLHSSVPILNSTVSITGVSQRIDLGPLSWPTIPTAEVLLSPVILIQTTDRCNITVFVPRLSVQPPSTELSVLQLYLATAIWSTFSLRPPCSCGSGTTLLQRSTVVIYAAPFEDIGKRTVFVPVFVSLQSGIVINCSISIRQRLSALSRSFSALLSDRRQTDFCLPLPEAAAPPVVLSFAASCVINMSTLSIADTLASVVVAPSIILGIPSNLDVHRSEWRLHRMIFYKPIGSSTRDESISFLFIGNFSFHNTVVELSDSVVNGSINAILNADAQYRSSRFAMLPVTAVLYQNVSVRLLQCSRRCRADNTKTNATLLCFSTLRTPFKAQDVSFPAVPVANISVWSDVDAAACVARDATASATATLVSHSGSFVEQRWRTRPLLESISASTTTQSSPTQLPEVNTLTIEAKTNNRNIITNAMTKSIVATPSRGSTPSDVPTHTPLLEPSATGGTSLSSTLTLTPCPAIALTVPASQGAVSLAAFNSAGSALLQVRLTADAPFTDESIRWTSSWVQLAASPETNRTRINSTAVHVTLQLLLDTAAEVVLTREQPFGVTAEVTTADCVVRGTSTRVVLHTASASLSSSFLPIRTSLPAALSTALQTTTALGGLAGGMLVGSGAAVTMQQSMLLFDLSVCQFSLSAPLSVADSPLRLCFGARLNACVRGAVVGNVMACAVFVVALLLFGWWLEGRWRTTLRAVRRNVALPGLFILPYLLLLQPTAAAAITLLRHPQNSSDVWVGAFGVVACSVVFLFFPLRILPFFSHVAVPADLSKMSVYARWVTPRYEWVPTAAVAAAKQRKAAASSTDGSSTSDSDSADEEHTTGLNNSLSASLARRLQLDGLRLRLSTFSSSYIVVFDAYGPGRHWFFVVEMLNAGLNGIIGGIKPITDAGCRGLAYGMLAVSVGSVFLALLRPYNSNVGTFAYMFQAIIGGAAACSLVLDDDGVADSFSLLLFISTITFNVVTFGSKARTGLATLLKRVRRRMKQMPLIAYLASCVASWRRNGEPNANSGDAEFGCRQSAPHKHSRTTHVVYPVATRRRSYSSERCTMVAMRRCDELEFPNAVSTRMNQETTPMTITDEEADLIRRRLHRHLSTARRHHRFSATAQRRALHDLVVLACATGLRQAHSPKKSSAKSL